VALPVTIPPQVEEVLQLSLAMANSFANVKTESQRKTLLLCFVVSELFKSLYKAHHVVVYVIMFQNHGIGHLCATS